MPSDPAAPVNLTKTVARNSFWYGLETGFNILTAFATSIAMARVIGPRPLGYFNYIMWLANMSGLVGSLGVPATTRKFMAEHLGRNQPGLARAIFFDSLALQVRMALAITAGGLLLVFTIADPAHRQVSAFQVASTLPAMVLAIPSQANVAAENLAANVPGSIVGQGLYILAVALSLLLGWNLYGIAVGIFFYRWVELALRLIPVLGWMRRLPAEPLPAGVRRRMRSFSFQGLILLALQMVVWERSDVVLLKHLAKDIGQVTFFTVSFNLTEKLLLLSQILSGAINASLMAQYGRDRSRLAPMVATAFKYLLLCVLPLLLGMASLSDAVIPFLYGSQFLPAIPVLALAAVFAIPKAVFWPAAGLLQATENQASLIRWTGLAGAVNILVDAILIPRHGALGAAIGNGLGQTAAVVGVWWRVRRLHNLRLDFAAAGKILAAGLAMAGVVAAISTGLRSWLALLAAVPTGAVVYLLAIRLTAALGAEERTRLVHLRSAVPHRFRRWFDRLVDFVAPVAAGQENR